jgi:methionyl-tRNA formyltransferase
MLNKQEGRVDWNKPVKQLDYFIRGMNPWPGAFTFLAEKRLRIIKAIPLDISSHEAPGTVLESAHGTLMIQTGHGALSIREIQGESGKRLLISDFLRGFPIQKGALFK